MHHMPRASAATCRPVSHRVRWMTSPIYCILLVVAVLLFLASPSSARAAQRWADGGVWSDNQLIMGTPNGDSNLLRLGQLIVRDYSNFVGGNYSYLVVDGVYGVQTRLAIQWFQIMHLLPSDGYIGSQTWTAMLNELTQTGTGSDYVAYTCHGYHQYRRERYGNMRWYFYLDGPARWYWANYHLSGPKPVSSPATGDGDEKDVSYTFTFNDSTVRQLTEGMYGFSGNIITQNRRIYDYKKDYWRRWINGVSNSFYDQYSSIQGIRLKVSRYDQTVIWDSGLVLLQQHTNYAYFLPVLSANGDDQYMVQTSSTPSNDASAANIDMFISFPNEQAWMYYYPGWTGWTPGYAIY